MQSSRPGPAAVLSLCAILALEGCASRSSTVTSAPAARMSQPAFDYLNTALDSLQAVTLRADTLPWAIIRDSAFLLAAGAQRPADTYGAIGWTLHRANKHSFLQVPTPGAASAMVRMRIGYIHVPQRGGAAVALADSLHNAVRALQDSGACGWIVDVRANGGGNMWPMLAGIGPLLGDTIFGSFRTGETRERWYYKDGMVAVLRPTGTLDTMSRVTVPAVRLRDSLAALAVLVDNGTGSSGEVVAIAFTGRPNTRTFGTPTAGFATVNRGLRLPDGANMVVTVGYNANRDEQLFIDELVPDVLVYAPTGWPSPTDRVATAAAEWLEEQQSCRLQPPPVSDR